MNVLLLVVDSLRAKSLAPRLGRGKPRTPFLSRLRERTISFRRAYASECWTLPSHASMFTGLLPSEHGAHFQSMAYARPAPTLAEILSRAGVHTEVVTRNSIFDGSIPGILRGFRDRAAVFSDRSPWSPLPLMLALSKPRFRRQIRTTGFFHPGQRRNRKFVGDFARATLPADHLALEHLLDRMKSLRRERKPFFLFCNLYDVHAPYPPSRDSILRPLRSLSAVSESLRMPFVMPCLGGHTYLRDGFELSEANRRMLLERYHRAIELMDEKLEDFWRSAEASGLLDDTMVVLTSDHGEAFGEHGLYLHDASVYDTHLHVPLWVHHPGRPAETIADVVSTRDLFGLIRAAGLGEPLDGTIFDRSWRARRPIALAEHFHYPHAKDMAHRYRQNVAAAVCGQHKAIVRREGVELYDLEGDSEELRPAATSLEAFEEMCRGEGIERKAASSAVGHLQAWRERQGWERLPDSDVEELSRAETRRSPRRSLQEGCRQMAADSLSESKGDLRHLRMTSESGFLLGDLCASAREDSKT
jgi:arylsulfatase A-like enzyme